MRRSLFSTKITLCSWDERVMTFSIHGSSQVSRHPSNTSWWADARVDSLTGQLGSKTLNLTPHTQ